MDQRPSYHISEYPYMRNIEEASIRAPSSGPWWPQGSKLGPTRFFFKFQIFIICVSSTPPTFNVACRGVWASQKRNRNLHAATLNVGGAGVQETGADKSEVKY